MKRRAFILGSAGFVGSVFSAKSLAAIAPCPPPELTIGGGSRVLTSCGSSVGLPGWVPSAVGQAALIPFNNRLQDVWVATGTQNKDGIGSQKFCDYSGGIYNPYYGPWGAHIIHGGGHAATNDNSVFLADYNDLEFKRIAGPTQLATVTSYDENIKTGGFPDDPFINPREVAAQVPGACHTYDNLLVLPPALCGDAQGALIRPVASAIGIEASRETGFSHALPLTTPVWQRWSINASRKYLPGGSCAFDTSRKRIWPLTESTMSHLTYLDCVTKQWTNVSGSPASVSGYPDMVYSAYHSTLDIIVMATHPDGGKKMNFYWFPAGSNGQARTPVSFSSGDLPTAFWGRGTLVDVPELQKLIYYTQFDKDAYYEITVPMSPVNSWSWIRRAIVGTLPSSLSSPVPATSMYRRMDYSPQLKSLVWVTGASSASPQFGGQVLAIRVAP